MPMGFITWGVWAEEDNGSPETFSQEHVQKHALLTRTDWNEQKEILISYEWNLLSRYLDLLEPYLAKTMRDWEQALDQKAEKIDDEGERTDFYEFHSDEYDEHLRFRGTLMNSFFLASFALFENQLMRICQSAQHNSRSPFSVNDLGRYSPTDRAKKYLLKLGVAFPAETSEWQEITKYREIRNKIMHEGGFLPVQAQIASFTKEKEIVTPFGGSLKLELTRPFCNDALSNMRRLLLDAHRAYVVWIKADK